MDVSEHDEHSRHRFEKLLTAEHEVKKEIEMTQPINLIEGGGMGGAVGGGLGAGVLGGLLGGAILGNGTLGNRGIGVNEGVVTPMQLQTATGSIVDSGQNNAIMAMLQGIATSIPVAEGNVQLALAQSTGQLSNQINTNLVSATQGFANVNDNVNRNTASIIAVGESIKDSVNATSAATQLAIANSVAQGLQNTNFIVTQVRDDGDKTRALLVAQNENTLRDANTALQIRLSETQAESRARGTEVTVTQTVNQNNLMQQQQQQQQQLVNTVSGLCHLVGNLQNAVATNSNMIIGNSGAVATGPNTANPINVRT